MKQATAGVRTQAVAFSCGRSVIHFNDVILKVSYNEKACIVRILQFPNQCRAFVFGKTELFETGSEFFTAIVKEMRHAVNVTNGTFKVGTVFIKIVSLI